MTSELQNWSGTYTFTARERVSARTVEDVQRAVAAGGRVRALGTRHSFNDLADNGATLVSVTGIAPDPVIDEAAGTVTAGAGMSYGALASWLQDRGWALHNLGSLPHISIAGAAATGTHGSGSRNQILSAALAGLEYVAADGELRQAGRQDEGFNGMAVGLGAFGIVVRVTLDIQPSYLVRQDGYAGLPWDRVLTDLEAVMSAGYSVSLFTDWSGDSVRAAWVKRRVDACTEAVVADELGGARRAPGQLPFMDPPADNLTVLGTPGPWLERLPHFRVDSTPSNGDEIQSEYFIQRDQGARALAAVRERARLITPLVRISEIRSTAADELWLSGSFGRETLAIHFTWYNRPDEVDAAVREVEAALEPFAARPHWGKVNHVEPARLAQLYPRFADARDLFEKLDPDGRFSNRRWNASASALRASSLGAVAGDPAASVIKRHSARAILLDDAGRLVLLRRTRPGQAPYWTTAGGGVEADDASVEAALHRELKEELGAEATGASQVLLFSFLSRDGLAVAHFFVARLVRMDVSSRTGPEFADPGRGAYDPEVVDLCGDALAELDLRPPEVKEFILANREALLAEAGLLA